MKTDVILYVLAVLGLWCCTGYHLEISLDTAPRGAENKHGLSVDEKCVKDEFMATTCTAMDNGEEVTVRMFLDEVHKINCPRTRIVARFTVGSDSFVRVFKTNRNKTYCDDDQEGTRYCFKVDVLEKRQRRVDKLTACLTITQPRTVSFGCFTLLKLKEDMSSAVSESEDSTERRKSADTLDPLDSVTSESESQDLIFV